MLIKTDRLTIRPFENEDLKDIYEIYSNEDVCKYLLEEPWNLSNSDKEFSKKLNNKSLKKKQL